jgi:hypothetical protein
MFTKKIRLKTLHRNIQFLQKKIEKCDKDHDKLLLMKYKRLIDRYTQTEKLLLGK